MDDKDRIGKQPTSDGERGRDDEFAIAGNAREKGQDPSPDDRRRGERSGADVAGGEPARRR